MFVLVLAAVVMAGIALERTDTAERRDHDFGFEGGPPLGALLEDLFAGEFGRGDLREVLPFSFEFHGDGPRGGFGFGTPDGRDRGFPFGPGDEGPFFGDGEGLLLWLLETLPELFGAHDDLQPVDELSAIENEIEDLRQILEELEARRQELLTESSG